MSEYEIAQKLFAFLEGAASEIKLELSKSKKDSERLKVMTEISNLQERLSDANKEAAFCRKRMQELSSDLVDVNSSVVKIDRNRTSTKSSAKKASKKKISKK
jgi:chromosome segregation ATPase